jgi:transposase
MEGDGWTITRCSLSGVRRRDGNAYLAHISLSPLYAWAKKGQRAYCSVPRNRGSNTTVLSSMTLLEGMGPSLTVEGATTSVVFETYVEQVLGASLRRGQVVVMDNLSAHKGGRIRDLIEGLGCELLYLPSYSPDFDLIEEAFSKIKGLCLEKARSGQKRPWLRRSVRRCLQSPPETLVVSSSTAATRWRFNHYGECCSGTQLSWSSSID